MKVCILAAGAGSRMDCLTTHTNKVLLPLHDKAIISHIFDQFPRESQFVVALGYQSEKVREYCKLVHSDLKIEFVEVEPFAGKGSGPGRSLFECRNFLQEEFFLVCGDTLWDVDWEIPRLDRNWVAVAPIPNQDASNFCLVEYENGKALEIYDKPNLSPAKPFAFTGLFFIRNYELFFEGLQSDDEIRGERQLSNGLKWLLHKSELFVETLPDWQDVGNYEAYNQANQSCPNYSFIKRGTFFYRSGKDVIKFFSDPLVVQQRVKRARVLEGLTPNITDSTKHFFKYRYIQGSTFDQSLTPALFRKFLTWADAQLWTDQKNDEHQFHQPCVSFYRDKTSERVELFMAREDVLHEVEKVNGHAARPVEQLLKELDWSFVERPEINRFHGDLLLNNVILDQGSGDFFLIDWRQSFSDQLVLGDRRYDLAKILLSLEYDFPMLKKKKFSASVFMKEVTTTFVEPTWSSQCIEILKDYCFENETLYEDIELIKNLILVNIAPLHNRELAQFFWSEGLRKLSQIAGQKNGA